ncbi:MAG: HAD-IA family hydrolase [Nodosilinea sp.]
MVASRPQVIFLDAVGTLFGVVGSVGAIYADLAAQHGIAVDPDRLNQAFFRSFKAAPPMAFGASDSLSIADREYQWWRRVAQQTYSSAGAIEQFVNFDRFFAHLYAHFATATPWVVYADVPAALQRWQRQGIELGIISNFDSRLYRVLDALNLASYFQSVTLASEVGIAKPDPQIFQVALQKHRCEADSAWHVGDSQVDDVAGARAAGLRPIWIQR